MCINLVTKLLVDAGGVTARAASAPAAVEHGCRRQMLLLLPAHSAATHHWHAAVCGGGKHAAVTRARPEYYVNSQFYDKHDLLFHHELAQTYTESNRKNWV